MPSVGWRQLSPPGACLAVMPSEVTPGVSQLGMAVPLILKVTVHALSQRLPDRRGGRPIGVVEDVRVRAQDHGLTVAETFGGCRR